MKNAFLTINILSEDSYSYFLILLRNESEGYIRLIYI